MQLKQSSTTTGVNLTYSKRQTVSLNYVLRAALAVLVILHCASPVSALTVAQALCSGATPTSGADVIITCDASNVPTGPATVTTINIDATLVDTAGALPSLTALGGLVSITISSPHVTGTLSAMIAGTTKIDVTGSAVIVNTATVAAVTSASFYLGIGTLGTAATTDAALVFNAASNPTMTSLTIRTSAASAITPILPNMNQLAALATLDLKGTSFTDDVATSFISSLITNAGTSLTSIDLSDSSLTGTLPAVTALATKIDVSGSAVIVNTAATLSAPTTALTFLGLGSSYLVTGQIVVGTYTTLTTLKIVGATTSPAQAVPDLSALVALTHLDLSNSAFATAVITSATGLKIDTTSAAKLTYLDLSGTLFFWNSWCSGGGSNAH